MTASEFTGPGLTAEQWEKISSLAVTLSPDQSLWISGYFAGLHYGRSQGAQALAGTAPLPLAAAAAAPQTRTLTILYASETGNSGRLAKAAAEKARAAGLNPTVMDMADYKPRKLKEEQDLLIIASTHGEGDPPQGAADFFEFVESRKMTKLPDLRFAVLSLGDSSYEHFCEAGKRMDRRFAELGAARLRDRVDCDVDYEDEAERWIEAVLAEISVQVNGAATVNAVAAPAAAVTYDKRRPFQAPVMDNIVLTGRGSTKETRHIELSLEDSGLTYTPGDALGIVARNDPAVVAALIDGLELAPDAEVPVKGVNMPLAEALEQHFEITIATPPFLEHWAKLSDASDLRALTGADQSAARADFLRQHHVIDIVRRYPVPGIAAADLTAGLRPLQPRLYSIACSLAGMPDEVHLTVSRVRYDLHGEPRSGVVSGHLAEHAPPDSLLPVYIHENPNFRLPADDVPIVMIGAGTGIAPYRAFMQEREARGAQGRSWLVFGERNFRTDFLYQTEWQRLLKDGVLSRLDVAFSRDGADKVYVQHRMMEAAADLFAWLEEGAHVYVCGDANALAPDVHEALIRVAETTGGLARDAAEEYVRDLQRARRYQRDVY